MSSLSFDSLRKLRPASTRRIGGRTHRRRAWRFAPQLIPLEVRALLSTITVTNDDDSGSGSLRDAIDSASAGDTIDFAPSAYGTITLTSGPLSAPNIDLTIQGPGRTISRSAATIPTPSSSSASSRTIRRRSAPT